VIIQPIKKVHKISGQIVMCMTNQIENDTMNVITLYGTWLLINMHLLVRINYFLFFFKKTKKRKR